MAFIDNKYNFARFDAGAQTLAGKHKLKKVAWFCPGAAGQNLVLTDAATTALCTIKNSAANEYIKITHLEDMWVDTLTVTTIDSGYLYVQYE